MKITGLLVTGLMFMIGSTNILNAATKCLALNSSSTCTGNTPVGRADWATTCNGISVKGVGICSSTAGTDGDTADTLKTGSSSDANKYCWCKMTGPATSKFAYRYTYSQAAFCYSDCASDCVGLVVYDSRYRALLFSNLE